MELDWSVDREGESSLVAVRVRNDGAVPRRVRIESRLDGPVLPPRRGGVPERGWDAGGVTAVIDPGERAAFGFAAVAEPVDPPVEIASVEPATAEPNGDDAATGGDADRVREAVRDLDSHRPPRQAVDGAGAVNGDGNAVDGDESGGARASDSDEDEDETERARSGADAGFDDAGSDDEADSIERAGEGDAERSATVESPPSAAADGVDAWFAAVEDRVERAERLSGADLETATAAVEEAGGLDAVASLDERVAADAERLRAVRDRAAALAERAEASEVPTAALEDLA
ncbi:hypothetical protein DVK05_10145 [Halorubrum sp. Atlit-8R]|uniref:DUF7857 domain-containing protein n=1 Tax=unclassified Halorubrum TaxID=2642239 RepID=UPI000EF1F6D2|nr:MULTISPECIES: hypothetical protein [unclassified Halorubrum]RLM68114.1 hypothetical protein DVK08_10210 [Halorubrum sp. Atlit-9R]RLM81343.1 hypothetical protein DVK05_10145 [Halorubrum sp. Atlit-8R]